MTRAPSPVPDFDLPSAYLAWDHDRLDALLTDGSLLIDEGELERARAPLDELRDGLTRHIRLEEEILFPIFETRTGIVGGPTRVMRYEHELIARHLAAMATSLDRHDGAGGRAACRALEAALGPHNVKEERILYPMVDNLLGDDERRTLTARLRAS